MTCIIRSRAASTITSRSASHGGERDISPPSECQSGSVYFERTLAGNRKGSGYILGRTLSYADLSIFQLIAGLRYAIPKAALGTEVSQAGAAAR